MTFSRIMSFNKENKHTNSRAFIAIAINNRMKKLWLCLLAQFH